jgi:hypothetical protein
MAEKTAKVYHSLPDSVKQQTMVYGDNYGEAGALSFYRKEFGLPEIHSDNASYVFWLPTSSPKNIFYLLQMNCPIRMIHFLIIGESVRYSILLRKYMHVNTGQKLFSTVIPMIL